MKNTLPLILAAAIAATPLMAAEGNKQGHAKRAAHMQEKFGVTDEQLTEMRRIREEGGSREDVRGVLTEQQRQEMHQWRQDNPRPDHPAGQKNKGGKGGTGGGGSSN